VRRDWVVSGWSLDLETDRFFVFFVYFGKMHKNLTPIIPVSLFTYVVPFVFVLKV
jgi:hypothetical protein